MKKVLAVGMALLLVGCTNKVEEEKNNYLTIKNDLETQTEFDTSETLPCDIEITLERESEETVAYKAVLTNPKQPMNNIKAILIHDGYTETVFPSIGLLNEKETLAEEKSIILEGVINTTKNIEKLSLELKLWIEYTDNEENIHTSYYKSTI